MSLGSENGGQAQFPTLGLVLYSLPLTVHTDRRVSIQVIRDITEMKTAQEHPITEYILACLKMDCHLVWFLIKYAIRFPLIISQ